MRFLLAFLLLPCSLRAAPALVYSQCTPAANETNATPFHYNVKYWGPLGTGSLASNLLVADINYANGITITISDNKSSTYTAGPVANSGASNMVLDRRFVAGVSAGVTAVTITTNVANADFQICMEEFSGVATSSPSDGSCSSIDTGPATVDCDATFTTTTAGDLIFARGIHGTLSGGTFCNDPSTGVTIGSGFTPTNIQRFCTQVGEYEVQSSAGAVNPSFTLTGNAFNYNFVAQAYKAAAAGTTPSGMYIAHKSRIPINTASQVFDFVTSGNLFVGAVDDQNTNSGGDVVTIGSCTPSNTWTKVAPTTSDPQLFYVAGASPSTTLHCTATAGASGNSTLLQLWDVVGAATSPQDASATCSSGASGQCHKEQGTSVTSPWNDAPDITPSTSSGISFAVIQIGNGPINATCGSFLLENTSYNGESDTGKMNNGDGWEALFYSSTAQQAYCWNAANSSTFSSVALAFKAPASAVNVPQVFVIRP